MNIIQGVVHAWVRQNVMGVHDTYYVRGDLEWFTEKR